MKKYQLAINLLQTNAVEGLEQNQNTIDSQNAINDLIELVELTTPPTADDVCKALSEYYKCDVTFQNNNFITVFKFINVRYITKFINGMLQFPENKTHRINNLPPHLIILIGEFYDNELKGVNNER